MRVALLFPGQGAQRPGMLASLPSSESVRATLAEARSVLGDAAEGLDSPERLAGTAGAQLALLIAGVASARALAEAGATADVVAGHSVGAFAAAVAAGALAFGDALSLVRLRGEGMAAARPEGHGMTAILGLPERRVAGLIDEASAAGPLYLANANAPAQVVVAGARPALERIAGLARRAGARRVEPLAVPTPSHCPLMRPVAERLERALAGVRLRPPRPAYASGRQARLLSDPGAIRLDLARNVAEPVRWHETTVMLRERGVRLFVEAEPGTVLTDLAADAFPDARAAALGALGVASAAALMRREREDAGGT